jgi:hypothetical protein
MLDFEKPNCESLIMNPDMMRFIVFNIMIFLLSLYPLDLQAQSAGASDPPQVEEGGRSGDGSTLDLFDENTESTKDGWIQFYVLAGFMYLDGDGKYSACLPNGQEITIIDFDRAGLKDTDSSYWLTLNWRSANSHWGAWFGSWRFDTKGTRMWEDSLTVGDKEIPVGATVTSDFDAKWYILEGTYSFYRSESVDAGIGFGFHMVDIDTTITAEIELGEQEGTVVSSRLDALAPLPNVLAYVHWKFAPRWNLIARYGYFGLDYDKYSGRMANAHAMVNYQVSQRWELGFGYQFVDLNLDIEKKDYTQVYDFEFSGPMGFAKFRF